MGKNAFCGIMNKVKIISLVLNEMGGFFIFLKF